MNLVGFGFLSHQVDCARCPRGKPGKGLSERQEEAEWGMGWWSWMAVDQHLPQMDSWLVHIDLVVGICIPLSLMCESREFLAETIISWVPEPLGKV